MKNIFNKVRGAYNHWYVHIAHLVLAMQTSRQFTQPYFGNPVYHFSGFLAGATGRVLDELSSVKCCKVINTKEFGKYNLKEVYPGELNPLIRKYPTTKQYLKKAIPIDILATIISSIDPNFGYALLSRDIISYFNNTMTANEMKEEVKKRNLEEIASKK